MDSTFAYVYLRDLTPDEVGELAGTLHKVNLVKNTVNGGYLLST